jgi:short subunit dehydrogenase-like uncharacterized protein
MITLFGATGYTGRLVARALARMVTPGQPGGVPLRLAGRSPEKLARLAESLPGSPGWLVADATRPATLQPLFRGSRVLVNCAGPFTDLGEAVVAQAALNGVHYLDTTNELGYVYRMQGYDTLARKNGAAIVPACGFEVALADCATEILALEMLSPETLSAKAQPPPGADAVAQGLVSQPTGREPLLDEVSVVYDIRGRGSSIGSRRSALRALATSWLGYRDGRWCQALPGREGRRVKLPGGPRSAISFPSSEIVTVPHHLPVRQVTAWLAASWHARYWAPALLPIFAWLAQGPVGTVVEAAISRIFPPPETGMRSQAPFTVLVEARRGSATRQLVLTGRGVYDLTAEIVAYAAGQLAWPGYDRAGVLPPAVALDPQALLDHAVAHWGITLSPGGQDA